MAPSRKQQINQCSLPFLGELDLGSGERSGESLQLRQEVDVQQLVRVKVGVFCSLHLALLNTKYSDECSLTNKVMVRGKVIKLCSLSKLLLKT